MSELRGIGLGSIRRVALVLAAALIVPACHHSNSTQQVVTIPSGPTTLVATPVSTARIDLTWVSTSSNENNFIIERSDDNGTTYYQIGTAASGTSAYSDLGLLPNFTYYYRVAASNAAGKSTYAGPVSATTNALTWKSSTGGPGIRADHTAIYDSIGRRMILFGGQDDFFTFYNDLWALDLLPSTATLTSPPTDHWAPLAATGTPPSARIGHSAVYDVQNNRMIVFGGEDGTPAPNQYQNDVYVLTLGASPAWSKPAIVGIAPSPRLGHSAVYDAANQQMIVFGGNDGTSELPDCYFLSLPLTPPFVWSNAPVGPSKRTEHSAVYDGVRQQMIIFGGIDHLPQLDGSVLNAETWALHLEGIPVWFQLPFSGGSPSFREGHSAVYDSANQRMALFGGDTQFDPSPVANSEFWSLRLDSTPTWVSLPPTSGSPPPARYGHTAVYDSGSQRMVIYGGYDSSGFPTFPDTWIGDF
jgi:hypothetical protein